MLNKAFTLCSHGRNILSSRHVFLNSKPVYNILRQKAATVPLNTYKAFPDISINAQRSVGKWLAVCAGCVFTTLVVGGATRLTESGLSITEWKPITGALPIFSEAQWELEFDKYKQYPEYKYLERELDMNGFKFIYFMEWFHRNLGRLTGSVFLFPAIYYWRKGYLAKFMKPRVIFYGALIGMQACVGMWMVNSGLKEDPEDAYIPRVSSYRLATHLFGALFLYTNLLSTSLQHLLPPATDAANFTRTRQIARLSKFANAGVGLIFFTAIAGAFVAGLDAGLVYNSWPKMADRWIPTDLFVFKPFWRNFFEHSTMAQFNHRHLGEFTGCCIMGFWLLSKKIPLPNRAKTAINVLCILTMAQVTMGVLTLLMYVPTWLACSHQANSVFTLSTAVWVANELKRIPK